MTILQVKAAESATCRRFYVRRFFGASAPLLALALGLIFLFLDLANYHLSDSAKAYVLYNKGTKRETQDLKKNQK